MLLMTAMGLVLPAALKLGNESLHSETVQDNEDEITPSDVNFSRANALFMVAGYIGYLVFQLGSHKEEFDYEGEEYAAFGGGHNIVRTPHFAPHAKKPLARRNVFCRKHCFLMKYCPVLEADSVLVCSVPDSTDFAIDITLRDRGDAQCNFIQTERTLLERKRTSMHLRSDMGQMLNKDVHGSFDEEITNLRGSNIKCHDSDQENLEEG
jgi:hypothetical protein